MHVCTRPTDQVQIKKQEGNLINLKTGKKFYIVSPVARMYKQHILDFKNPRKISKLEIDIHLCQVSYVKRGAGLKLGVLIILTWSLLIVYF